MKKLTPLTLLVAMVAIGHGQTVTSTAGNYQNFIRQVQLPYGEVETLVWSVPVPSEGQQLSALAIDVGGARFELHTVHDDPFVGYLLDSKYVGSTVPVAEVQIRTEDPYETVPRTRADRPFNVEVKIQGILNDPNAPASMQSVKLLHHSQAYPANGDGTAIDREQATLLDQSLITNNGNQTLRFLVNSIPGANRAKVRGEERFSVFSIPDAAGVGAHLDSLYVQIWPVADGAIYGLPNGGKVKFKAPTLTIAANDLYPDSQTYVQIYPGSENLGTEGTVIPGSGRVINESVPQDRLIVLKDWEGVIDSDGTWTIELLTKTPFGIDRLDWLSFEVDRSITVNSTVTTSE